MKEKTTRQRKNGTFVRYLKDKECKFCSKSFRPRNSKSIFCSRGCRSESRKKRYEKKCVLCEVKFSVPEHRKERAKVCSKKCAIELLKSYKDTDKWKEAHLVALAKRKGKNHPRYGKTHTAETKQKMSIAKKKNPSRYWLGKEQPHHQGEKNVNWKGGVTPIHVKLRKGIRYKEWRKSVFARDDYECKVCFAAGYVQAHHIQKFSDYPDKRFETENGITLCRQCHRITQNREHLFIKFFQGILRNGANSAKTQQWATPSQQERLRKALWACVTVRGE